MKKTVSALLAALCLCLSGCTPSLLSREYSYSAAHTEYPVSDTSAVLQAENYQGLLNAILYFVTDHRDTGIVHLTYLQDSALVSAALDDACREVRSEDALGAYTVEDIQYGLELLPSYCEVTVSITYAHTAEEVAAIIPLAGSSAVRQALSAAMSSFAEKCVFRISYFTGDAGSLHQLIQQTWLDTPLALVKPEVGIAFFPDSGTNRIIEISLHWPEDPQVLAQRSAALEQQALELLERTALVSEKFTPLSLLSSLKWASIYDRSGADSAYAALVEGRANDQGFTQALRLLCQLSDLEATVVEGELDGTPRCWLIVSTSEGYRHVDPTQEQPEYATDTAFTAAGFTWEAERYPACIEYTSFPGSASGGL